MILNWFFVFCIKSWLIVFHLMGIAHSSILEVSCCNLTWWKQVNDSLCSCFQYSEGRFELLCACPVYLQFFIYIYMNVNILLVGPAEVLIKRGFGITEYNFERLRTWYLWYINPFHYSYQYLFSGIFIERNFWFTESLNNLRESLYGEKTSSVL